MLGKMFGTHHYSIFKSFPTPPWLLFFLYHAVFNNVVFAYANSVLMYVFLTMDVNKYTQAQHVLLYCSVTQAMFAQDLSIFKVGVCIIFVAILYKDLLWLENMWCVDVIFSPAVIFLWNSHSFKCQNDRNILMYSEWIIYLNVCYMSSQLI